MSGIIAGFGGWRLVYVIAAILNLIMILIMIYVLPDLPRKNKLTSYKKLIFSVFTAAKRYKVLPRILLQSGLILGLIFNIFWTSLTFLLSGSPFNYTTTQIGFVSLTGLVTSLFGVVVGKLQDNGLSIPALGLFIFLSLIGTSTLLLNQSIITVIIVTALISIAVQGVLILSQTRLFSLSNNERSRLNTVFVVNNFIFGAMGSALSSFLWSYGGLQYVMIGSIIISSIGLIAWFSSRTVYYEMDNKLEN